MNVPGPCTVVMALVVMAISRSYAMQVVRSYRDIDNHRLMDIDMSPSVEAFVISSTNKLLKLNDNLDLMELASIALNESYYIHVIDRKSMILCSRVNGICKMCSLSDVNLVLHSYPEQVLPKDSVQGINLFSINPNQIYIANSFISDQEHSLNSVPHISSRLTDSLHLYHQDSNGSSSKFLNLDILQQHPSFFVTYVYTFTQGAYVYFISRRPNLRAQEEVVFSTISRLCIHDKYFRSYVEIPLDCVQDSNIQYSLAMAAHYNRSLKQLFVSFSGGDRRNSITSAVCQFELHDVDNKMDQTILDCYNGQASLGPEHMIKAQSCVATSVKPDFCGHSEAARNYSSIEGVQPLSQRPLITLPHTSVTTLTSGADNHGVVVYLGTSDGNLKKVIIDRRGLVTMASEISLDRGHGVINPIFLDRNGDYLYAMTESKVMKIDTDHCQEKTTCQQCTTLLDSMCGWCVLENRCTKESECQSVEVSPRWLPSRNSICTDMKIYPDVVSYQTASHNWQISLKLDQITVVDNSSSELQCNFIVMDTQHKTTATVNGRTITCPLPAKTKLPALPSGLDHYSNLEVEFQIKGKSIVKRDVPMYNCGLNQNCTTCTDSAFGCQWCYVRGMCMDANSSDCLNGKKTVLAITSFKDCPRLETSSHDTDVVVHSGHNKSISVNVTNLKTDQLDNILCLFTYNNDVKIVKGEVMLTNLQCQHHLFEFSDPTLPIVTAVFTVTVGPKPNNFLLDNPQNIKVRIYKCGQMVTNCGQCLSMDPEYECGWCIAGIPHCSLHSGCPPADWLNRTATCPDPQVLRFNPMAGPIQGRTNISVTGLNLGKSHKDLHVTIAGLLCNVQPYQYESSQRFQCQIVGPKHSTDGIIHVNVSRTYATKTAGHFKFVDPVLSGLSPLYGPFSGGTTLTISGTYMNAGSLTTVEVGGAFCQVITANMSSLICVTPLQQKTNSSRADVEVNFGDFRKLVPAKFTYVQDPIINRIEPKITILSGGTSITATGSHMDVLQKPEFFVDVDGIIITTECFPHSATLLICKAPSLNFLTDNITETNPKEAHYGFNLDGVVAYRNISTDPKFSPLLYYPNPDVEYFSPAGKKFEPGYVMVIKGIFQNINPIIQDVRVLVGGSLCSNVMATNDALSCTAPEQPVHLDNNGNAIIMLYIGNMKKEVGYLSYYENKDEQKPIATGIILGVVLPIIAIVVLLGICVFRRHVKHKPSENYIPDIWKEEVNGDEEQGMAMNQVAVKADMNGSIPDDKDTKPYIEELLSKIEDNVSKQNAEQLLIPRRSLHTGDLLGKGNFGATYRATYTKDASDSIPNDVVVKTIQGSLSDSESVAKFLQTMTHFCNLQHPGIIPINGICITVSQDPMLIIPYLQNGDLKTFVRDYNTNLTVIELLDFAYQIAEAMDYLATHSVVHGNLALRNCLLSDEKKVLVGDYGLFRDLFSKDQYTKDADKNKSLIKWTAPEVVEGDGLATLTTKSDVWSYGIVLWELLTRGVSPYPDVDSSEIVAHLKAGNRMRKPKQCPEAVYNLMLRCWHLNPDSRPTFREITSEIQSLSSLENNGSGTEESTPLQNNIASTGGEVV